MNAMAAGNRISSTTASRLSISDNGVRAMLDLCMFAEGAEQQETLTAVGDIARLEAFIPAGDLVRSLRVPLGAPKQVTMRHVPVDEAALKAGTHHGSVYYQLLAFIDAIMGRGPIVGHGDGWIAGCGPSARLPRSAPAKGGL